jgi:general secretion pathway protein D
VIREAQRQFNPKVEPSLDQLVIDYMGAVPPLPPAPGAADTVFYPEPRPVLVPLAPAPPRPSQATPTQ